MKDKAVLMRLKTRNKPNQENTVQSWDSSTTVTTCKKISLFQHAITACQNFIVLAWDL
jgi:hypothetical protein